MEDTSPKEPPSPLQSDGVDMNGISSDVAQIKISATQAEEKDTELADAPDHMEEDNQQKVEEEIVSPVSPITVADANEDDQVAIPDLENPETPLPDFDWSDFEERYRLAMKQANGKQDKLLEEFESLVRYFGIWAEASSGYDDDRSFKRLKTRESFVQRAEGNLDQRKQHYTQVVAAFQSALALLQGV